MDVDSTSTPQDVPSPWPVYELLVQELQPESAVSLIDTDMEAQVVPSLETEQVRQATVSKQQHDGPARGCAALHGCATFAPKPLAARIGHVMLPCRSLLFRRCESWRRSASAWSSSARSGSASRLRR